MPTLAELVLALLGPDPLTRQERRLIARHLCRLMRERGFLDQSDDLLVSRDNRRLPSDRTTASEPR